MWSEEIKEALVLLIPFLGTALGAAMVFFMKRKMIPWLEKVLMGFAAGVMIASSVWSLLIPSIEMAGEQGGNTWLPTATGFLLGMGFLLLLDSLLPHIHTDNEEAEDVKNSPQKYTMLILSVTLHNLPEGMAVGVVLAGALLENTGMALMSALVLSIGIAIQNFPEGAIISMPLRNMGKTRRKAFGYGVLSGVVEPAGALVTLLLAEQVVQILPCLLAFAAGAMIYVVVEELLPESQSGERFHIGTVGVAAGFALMMVLDIALG